VAAALAETGAASRLELGYLLGSGQTLATV
jgi:hypothetical protein